MVVEKVSNDKVSAIVETPLQTFSQNCVPNMVAQTKFLILPTYSHDPICLTLEEVYKNY